MFSLICVFLIPPFLKNAFLLSPEKYIINTADIIAETLVDENGKITLPNIQNNEELRITVFSPSLEVIADSSKTDNTMGKFIILPGTENAMNGEKVFNAYVEEDAFVYSVLCPVSIGNETHLLYIRHTNEELAQEFAFSRRACTTSGLLLLITPIALLIYNIIDLSKRMNALTLSVTQLTSSDYVLGKALTGNDEISNISQILEDYAALQQKTDELKRRFVSDASHELKTPLAAVKLLSDTILLTPDMKHEDVCEFLTDISNEIDRLTRICSNLLQITKHDTIGAKAELVPLDLSVVAENVSRILNQPASTAGLELRHELQHGCFVLANYDIVFQIFYNLIENAIKYGAEGKEVRVFLFRRDENIIFIVDDDGMGIPSNDLERIFDRFYRVDKARARATGGTGLGLSIVASAVQTCRGTVEAQNRAPHGARFIVKFPSCPAPETKTERGEAE